MDSAAASARGDSITSLIYTEATLPSECCILHCLPGGLYGVA